MIFEIKNRFTGAVLRGADLRGADLGGADLGGADLGGLILLARATRKDGYEYRAWTSDNDPRYEPMQREIERIERVRAARARKRRSAH